MEDVVRAASELGVRVLRPLLFDRTVMEPSQGKLDRWRRVAEESMRQCGRTQMMEVTEPIGLPGFLALSAAREVSRFVLHPGAPGRFPWRLSSPGGLIALVGPEGGLCDCEFELAAQAGFVPVSLGETILRIETAAMVAATLSIAATDCWLEDIDFNQYQHKNS
jgi:16S rRNA (uracil1498-N3)-methyltransferase